MHRDRGEAGEATERIYEQGLKIPDKGRTVRDMTNTDVCPECGGSYAALPGSRHCRMLTHMVNAGEITVGEAEAELATRTLPRDAEEFLAGWVLSRRDQGDGWRAGDPVLRPDGKVVAYVDECVEDRHLVQDGDDTWSCDPEWAEYYGVSSAVR